MNQLGTILTNSVTGDVILTRGKINNIDFTLISAFTKYT